MCLHFETLLDHDGARVTACRCRPEHAARTGEEESCSDSIVLVRRGVFVKHTPAGLVAADPNTVVFFRAGEPYQVSHPGGCGDDCTVLRIPEPDLRDAVRAQDPAAADSERPVRFSHGPACARMDLAHRRLVHALRRGSADPAEAAETVLDLIDAALRSSARAWGASPARRPARERTRRADRDRVEAARAVLAAGFRGRVLLSDAARAAGCSTYHLSRAFRRRTGATIAEYVRGLRLRAAIDAILAGGRDLTDIALDAGFYDHSHFTNAFTRAFGQPPSALRDPRRLASIASSIRAN